MTLRSVLTQWRQTLYRYLAAEISAISRYFDEVVQFAPLEHDTGELLSVIDGKLKYRVKTAAELKPETSSRLILLNANLNHDSDIVATLKNVYSSMNRTSRLVAVVFNPYWRGLYTVASRLGIRRGPPATTFLTRTDLSNLATLAGFQVQRYRHCGYFPADMGGIGRVINWIAPIIPLVRWLSLCEVIILRPIIREKAKPSLSVLVPARNERGNLQPLLERVCALPLPHVEVVLVEGHSKDGTFEEAQRLLESREWRVPIQLLKQRGIGKADAVRMGFEHATGDLVIILDADMTVPPEAICQFYEAYCEGHGDFINGTRLLYPMEGAAMRPLNLLGNVGFAKLLGLVLNVRIGDSLCGSKLLARSDYARCRAWREDFGDFDPFGDFELIFPAAILGFGIIDIPVSYKNRVYGTTQIQRFRDGLRLLNMCLHGVARVACGRVPPTLDRLPDLQEPVRTGG
jgi:hypothetical protein